MFNLIHNEFTKLGYIKILTPYIIFTIIPILQKYFLNSITTNTLFYLIPFISIVLVIIFSSIISSEIENGTFRLYLTKPASRHKVIISKLLTSFIYSFFLTTYILVLYDFLVSTFSFTYYFKYYVYTIPIHFILSLSILLSICIKYTPINVGICIIIQTFSGIVTEILFKNNITLIQYTFFPYLDFSIFLNKESISYINSIYNVNLSLSHALFINMCFILLFLTISLLLFTKKDIKS